MPGDPLDTTDFRPNWMLGPIDALQVQLSISLGKHIPGWSGATDDQLEAVARDIWAEARRSLVTELILGGTLTAEPDEIECIRRATALVK